MKYQHWVIVWALEHFQDLQKNKKLTFISYLMSKMRPYLCKMIENLVHIYKRLKPGSYLQKISSKDNHTKGIFHVGVLESFLLSYKEVFRNLSTG